ncbi:hypothetical protein ACBQ24_09540 [Acinetobacter terrestris]|uniref:hypothetical protein n=1 Tax=Acinetobacter terrestris TaxID=2529843 RepID=UPI003524A962
MPPSIPKTKADEVKEIINNTLSGDTLSEFNYVRCIRLLKEIELFTAQDQINMLRGILELYVGNLHKAKELALVNYEISNDFQVLRNAVFIFQQVMALDWVVKTMGRMSEISKKVNIDLKESLPPAYELSYFLSGNLSLAEDYFKSKEMSTLLEDLRLIQESLEISNESLKDILQIVHKAVVDNNARYNFLEYSYIDEEFLLTIFLHNSHNEVSQLNAEVAKQCYQSGLLDELNKVSYLFLPSESGQI